MLAIPKLLLLRTVLCILLFSLPALFAPRKLKAFLDEYIKNPPAERLLGMIVLVYAFLLFMVHISFDGTRYMIFSFLGRASLIKGIRLIRFPSSGTKTASSLYGNKIGSFVMGIVTLLMCAFLLRVVFAGKI